MVGAGLLLRFAGLEDGAGLREQRRSLTSATESNGGSGYPERGEVGVPDPIDDLGCRQLEWGRR